jgi:hypothetical protein
MQSGTSEKNYEKKAPDSSDRLNFDLADPGNKRRASDNPQIQS